MKARIKLRIMQGAMRGRVKRKDLRCPKAGHQIRRKMMATTMVEAGVSAREIAWHFGWPLADVERWIDASNTLR